MADSASRSFRFRIEPGHVVAFARSLGYPERELVDTDGVPRADLRVPPTFLVAGAHFDPTFPHGQSDPPAPAAESAAPGSPTGVRMHAEEHFELCRAVRLGEMLTVTTEAGRSWTRSGRRGGVLTFTEELITYRDDDGAVVAVVRRVRVVAER